MKQGYSITKEDIQFTLDNIPHISLRDGRNLQNDRDHIRRAIMGAVKDRVSSSNYKAVERSPKQLRLILSLDHKKIGVIINRNSRSCTMEGCTGVLQYVRWEDGTVTFPCTKGCQCLSETVSMVGFLPSAFVSQDGDVYIDGNKRQQKAPGVVCAVNRFHRYPGCDGYQFVGANEILREGETPAQIDYLSDDELRARLSAVLGDADLCSFEKYLNMRTYFVHAGELECLQLRGYNFSDMLDRALSKHPGWQNRYVHVFKNTKQTLCVIAHDGYTLASECDKKKVLQFPVKRCDERKDKIQQNEKLLESCRSTEVDVDFDGTVHADGIILPTKCPGAVFLRKDKTIFPPAVVVPYSVIFREGETHDVFMKLPLSLRTERYRAAFDVLLGLVYDEFFREGEYCSVQEFLARRKNEYRLIKGWNFGDAWQKAFGEDGKEWQIHYNNLYILRMQRTGEYVPVMSENERNISYSLSDYYRKESYEIVATVKNVSPRLPAEEVKVLVDNAVSQDNGRR